MKSTLASVLLPGRRRRRPHPHRLVRILRTAVLPPTRASNLSIDTEFCHAHRGVGSGLSPPRNPLLEDATLQLLLCRSNSRLPLLDLLGTVWMLY
jgi:hypothetical protein